jgi:hypothetical protein
VRNQPVADIHPTRQEPLTIENLEQEVRYPEDQTAMPMLPAENSIPAFCYGDHMQ